MILVLFAAVASGGYGYYVLVINEDDTTSDGDSSSSSNNAPVAKINPTNPRIQMNDTVLFTASDSTDIDNDELSYVWMFEGDTREYEGRDIERSYPDEGSFEVKLLVTDSTGLSDEAITTVTVISNYHGEFDGTLEEGESETITFPVEAGAVSLEVDWNLTDVAEFDITNPQADSVVDMYLEDSEGNVLENNTNEGEGSGSWSILDDRLEPNGTYIIFIECTSGEMEYEIVVNVKY